MLTLPPRLATLFIALFLALPSLGLAEEFTYYAKLSGEGCDGCRRNLTKALTDLEGVETVRFVSMKDGTHRMDIVTTGPDVSPKAAAKKLFKEAGHYDLVAWLTPKKK